MANSNGRVALVTGASSGIGAAVAARLRGAGFQVFGTSRRGGDHLTLDVRDPASVSACVEAAMAGAGRIDVLVNNAGYALLGGVEECAVEQAADLFDVNLFGALRMALAVLPHMRARRSGRIVCISSVVGFMPAPFMAHYCASKHALEGLTESLDHEVRPFGVRAILVQPGFVKTRIERNMVLGATTLKDYEARRTALHKVLDQAMARAADPSGVAETVLRAATASAPRLRYTTGGEAAFLGGARRFLPERMFDRSLRRQFQLDRA